MKELPQATAYHSSVVVDNHIYIFGGRAEVCGLFGTLDQNLASRDILTNETWVFGPEMDCWSHLDVTEKPPARAKHTAVVWENNMLVFGGETQSGFQNDVWILSVSGK